MLSSLNMAILKLWPSFYAEMQMAQLKNKRESVMKFVISIFSWFKPRFLRNSTLWNPPRSQSPLCASHRRVKLSTVELESNISLVSALLLLKGQYGEILFYLYRICFGFLVHLLLKSFLKVLLEADNFFKKSIWVANFLVNLFVFYKNFEKKPPSVWKGDECLKKTGRRSYFLWLKGMRGVPYGPQDGGMGHGVQGGCFCVGWPSPGRSLLISWSIFKFCFLNHLKFYH